MDFPWRRQWLDGLWFSRRVGFAFWFKLNQGLVRKTLPRPFLPLLVARLSIIHVIHGRMWSPLSRGRGRKLTWNVCAMYSKYPVKCTRNVHVLKCTWNVHVPVVKCTWNTHSLYRNLHDTWNRREMPRDRSNDMWHEIWHEMQWRLSVWHFHHRCPPRPPPPTPYLRAGDDSRLCLVWWLAMQPSSHRPKAVAAAVSRDRPATATYWSSGPQTSIDSDNGLSIDASTTMHRPRCLLLEEPTNGKLAGFYRPINGFVFGWKGILGSIMLCSVPRLSEQSQGTPFYNVLVCVCVNCDEYKWGVWYSRAPCLWRGGVPLLLFYVSLFDFAQFTTVDSLFR